MVKDIQTLELIYTLVKERGFTLLGAQKELKKKRGQKKDLIIDKLLELRTRIVKLKSKV